MKMKIYILAVLGTIVTLFGAYRLVTAGTAEVLYLGVSTLIAVAIYCLIIPRYREIISFVLALLVLHSGVILLFADTIDYPEILGSIVFVCGVVFVMSSNFSDYLKNKKTQ